MEILNKLTDKQRSDLLTAGLPIVTLCWMIGAIWVGCNSTTVAVFGLFLLSWALARLCKVHLEQIKSFVGSVWQH